MDTIYIPLGQVTETVNDLSKNFESIGYRDTRASISAFAYVSSESSPPLLAQVDPPL